MSCCGLVRTGALTLAALLAFVALGQAEEIAPEPAAETPPVSAADAPWVPTLEFGGKTGTERHLWEVDATLPIFQNETMLTFFDGRLRGDDDGSEEFNLGLAFRRIVSGGEAIVGLYGFYDLLHSGFNNTYHQGTIGAEYLARGFELRGNAYLPEAGVRSTGGVGSASGAQIVGNQIQVLAGGGERALPGFDLEGGVRLPWVEDLWLRAALFHFSASHFDDVTGPRFSAEWGVDASRFFRGAELTLGAEWQTDQIRGAQGFASVFFKIPLGAVPEKASRPSWTYDRMQAKIRRDIDIVVAEGDGSAVPAIDPATGKPFGEVYFADATSDETGAGTFADPTDLVTAYERAGEGGVVVALGEQGDVWASGEEFPVPSGLRLLGGGSTLMVSAGGSATDMVLPGTRPTLINEGDALWLAEGGSDYLLKGFDIETDGDAIRGYGNANVEIVDVGILASGYGVYLDDASGAITLAGSQIVTGDDDAFRIQNGDSGEGEPGIGFPIQLLISNNEIEALDDDALDLDVNGEGSTVRVLDNVIVASSDAVDADVDAAGATFEFSGNTVSEAYDGFELDADYGSVALTVTNNTFVGLEDAIDVDAGYEATITGVISNNTIDPEGGEMHEPEYTQGIRVQSYEGTIDIEISGNTISNTGMEAIEVEGNAMSTVTALIRDNVLSNTSWYVSSSSSSTSSTSASIVVRTDYEDVVDVTLENNTVDNGIALYNDGSSQLTVNACPPQLSTLNGGAEVIVSGDVRDGNDVSCSPIDH